MGNLLSCTGGSKSKGRKDKVQNETLPIPTETVSEVVEDHKDVSLQEYPKSVSENSQGLNKTIEHVQELANSAVFSEGNGPSTTALTVYKVKHLARATQNFAETQYLGEGGFGTVYKGVLKDPTTKENYFCAVKKLDPTSFQSHREWLAEIQILGNHRNNNLVRLYGYCAEQGNGMLVYEFVSGGSLDRHLFEPEGHGYRVLNWAERLKIALQTAEGLGYLHSNNVIHRDFKASNILLDEHRNAKLTDFGLAKELQGDRTHVTTRIMGTLGYLDPRFLQTGQLTKASDVYSFGVLLLELLTGRHAMDPGSTSQRGTLVQWAGEFLSCRKLNVLEFVDPQLQGELHTKVTQRLALKLAITAKHCVEDNPNSRPTISDVCATLNNLINGFSNQKGA